VKEGPEKSTTHVKYFPFSEFEIRHTKNEKRENMDDMNQTEYKSNNEYEYDYKYEYLSAQV
jgi:hypothetical protein